MEVAAHQLKLRRMAASKQYDQGVSSAFACSQTNLNWLGWAVSHCTLGTVCFLA